MRKTRLTVAGILGISALLLLGIFARVNSPARTQEMGAISGAIKGPENYERAPLDLPEVMQFAPMTQTHAVAIVGEVGDYTAGFISDMEGAVTALRNHGVLVTTFYYGQDTFSWADIVTAATGANFILYAGHGVYWGGTCANPTDVGGFYLGPKNGENFGFVRGDDIRTDLGPRLDDQAVVLLTHACYAAGNTGCDPTGSPDLAEASRRVSLYADAFIDAGFDAYYANNYYNSLANYVNKLMAESNRPTYGDAFKGVYPNNSSNHHPFAYSGGNVMWLNGSTGAFSHAFVGDAEGTFSGDTAPVTPELGHIPEGSAFFYDPTAGIWSQNFHALHLENLTSTEPVTVYVQTNADWLCPPLTIATTPVTVTMYVTGTPTLGATALVTITGQAETPLAQNVFTYPVTLHVQDNFPRVFLPFVGR